MHYEGIGFWITSSAPVPCTESCVREDVLTSRSIIRTKVATAETIDRVCDCRIFQPAVNIVPLVVETTGSTSYYMRWIGTYIDLRRTIFDSL